MWRTSDSTIDAVHYGNSPLQPLQTPQQIQHAPKTILKISGIKRQTKYYYNVGFNTTVLTGGNEQHHFTTAVNPSDSTTGFRFG